MEAMDNDSHNVEGDWDMEDVLARDLTEIYEEGSDDEGGLEDTIITTTEEEEEEVQGERGADVSGWVTGPFTPQVPLFSPPKEPGPQCDMQPDAKPLDFLLIFITRAMMEKICLETNRYASRFLETSTLSSGSRFNAWRETTPEEMWAFFGLITAMGLIQISDLKDYWSLDELFGLKFFHGNMARDRFLNILAFLHINDNSQFVPRGQPGFDPLFKIAPFITCLETTFSVNWYPSMNVAIDEAMIAWRGNLSFRVYNPDKPNKFGVKVFQLCDSSNAYCCKFEIYTGKKEASANGATYDVCMRLLTPYLGYGHRLYMDNYYTAPLLFKHLYDQQTAACGTVRLNTKGLDPEMKKKKVVKKKGDAVSKNDGTMTHIKFMERREVNLLTTIHTESKSDSGRRDRAKQEPIVKHDAILDYNKYTGAVDRSDQMIQYHSFKRKTLKWWKKVFFHLFMLAKVNAYLVYKEVKTRQGQNPMSHRNFHRELAKSLVRLYPSNSTPRKSLANEEDTKRLTERHFITKIPCRPWKRRMEESETEDSPSKKRPTRRLCVVCSTTTGKKKTKDDGRRRKETSFECKDCDAGLCITPCFMLYHTQKDYKRAWRRLEEGQRNEDQ